MKHRDSLSLSTNTTSQIRLSSVHQGCRHPGFLGQTCSKATNTIFRLMCHDKCSFQWCRLQEGNRCHHPSPTVDFGQINLGYTWH